jgi:hypothetical protein
LIDPLRKSSAFGLVANLAEHHLDRPNVVALKLDRLVLQCPACAAFRLELSGKACEIVTDRVNLAYDGDDLTSRSFLQTNTCGLQLRGQLRLLGNLGRTRTLDLALSAALAGRLSVPGRAREQASQARILVSAFRF